MPENLFFDVSYFKDLPPVDTWDDGGGAQFRLTTSPRVQGDAATRAEERTGSVREVFLVLYNSHNGYYGHGFDFTVGGKKIQDGCL